jgi:hypothetical protein
MNSRSFENLIEERLSDGKENVRSSNGLRTAPTRTKEVRCGILSGKVATFPLKIPKRVSERAGASVEI